MEKHGKNTEALAFTYYFADGQSVTYRSGDVGPDGAVIPEEVIVFLRESNHREYLDERYQEENTSYDFLNAQEKYDRNPDDYDAAPINCISDPSGNILRQLFPVVEHTPRLIKLLREALPLLTETQRDLICDLYGLQRPIVDLANEQGVTEAAIRNRRNKILKRLKKLIEAQSDREA